MACMHAHAYVLACTYIHVDVIPCGAVTHRYNDPPYVKMKKLELLTEVCTASTTQIIVGELG